MAGPVSELIIDAVASTVLPDITMFAVRVNMVEDALCIGSLAVNLTIFARIRRPLQVSGNTVEATAISD